MVSPEIWGPVEKSSALSTTPFAEPSWARAVVITAGVEPCPPNSVVRFYKRPAPSTPSPRANDPHGEHDFGSIDEGALRCFRKIDCYDRATEMGSSADPAVTTRVLTIMLGALTLTGLPLIRGRVATPPRAI